MSVGDTTSQAPTEGTDPMGRYARLTPYELAAEYRLAAIRRCRSREEDAERQTELAEIGAEMDRRDVWLEDWDVHNRRP